MKKIFLSLGAFVLVLSLGLALGGCRDDKDEKVEEGTVEDTSFNQDFLGITTIASMGAIQDFESNAELQSQLNLSLYDNMDVLKEVESLEKYMSLVQTFIGGQENFDVDVVVASDSEYSNTMTITFVNMEGELDTHVMYFDEVVTVDESKVESTIDGIMNIDETPYILEGTRKIEDGEEELELKAYLDEENYITISYEVEAEKDEYELELLIEYFTNDQLIKSIEIDFEETYDEEIELSMKFLDGVYEKEFEFDIEKDGNATEIAIELKISENGNVVEEWDIEILIVYNEELDEYEITYKIDKKIEGEEQV